MVPALGRSSPASARSVVVLPQPRGPEQGQLLARLHREADAAHGHDRAVYWMRRSSTLDRLRPAAPVPRARCCSRSPSQSPPGSAAWRVATRRRCPSLPPPHHGLDQRHRRRQFGTGGEPQISTMAGVITLLCGPISRIDAPSSRTALAMKSNSQAGQQSRPQQRHRHRHQPVDPRRAATSARISSSASSCTRTPRRRSCACPTGGKRSGRRSAASQIVP